jgi:hypothetical protein
MIAGNVFAAEFPRSRIEISNVDYVAGGFTDLYAITYSERLPNEDTHPGNEVFIGVCTASPIITKPTPSAATAAYQFTKIIDIAISAIARATTLIQTPFATYSAKSGLIRVLLM